MPTATPRFSKAILLELLCLVFLVIGVAVLAHDDVKLRRALSSRSQPRRVVTARSPQFKLGEQLDLVVMDEGGKPMAIAQAVANRSAYLWFFDPGCSVCTKQIDAVHAAQTQVPNLYGICVRCGSGNESPGVRTLALKKELSRTKVAAIPQLVRIDERGIVVATFATPADAFNAAPSAFAGYLPTQAPRR